MKATGIIRRIDDLGRVVIPKEVRQTMEIKEGEALEIYTIDGGVCFKKFEETVNIAEECAKWVNDNRKDILAVSLFDDTTAVVFARPFGQPLMGQVKHHPKDAFDVNIAICYAAEKTGFYITPVHEKA